MNIIVCGSRTWSDPLPIWNRIGALPKGTTVITGDGRGADRIADEAAKEYGLDRIIVPANWKRYGRAAGPIRNQRMLDLGPVQVIAFLMPNQGTGTLDMIAKARRADVEVEIISPHTLSANLSLSLSAQVSAHP